MVGGSVVAFGGDVEVREENFSQGVLDIERGKRGFELRIDTSCKAIDIQSEECRREMAYVKL